MSQTRTNFIYVTGCDGTGKSTQARLLIDVLQSQGLQVNHLWLRFPFFLTLPLLVYARLRGFSWYEEVDGVRQGHWDFRESWILCNVLPWVLLVDAVMASIRRVYLPLVFGKTIVCERFVLDMLTDLAVALDRPDFYRHRPGSLFLRLLPSNSLIAILDLDPQTLQTRRPDLVADKHLRARVDAFRQLAEGASLRVISSELPINEVSQLIRKEMNSYQHA